MAQNYISIKQIADNIYDNPLLQEVSFERIVNYAAQFSQMVGLPQVFNNHVAELNIKDHRAPLPCDFYNVIQVKESCSNETFTAATDSFFYSSTGRGLLTYKIQDGFIYTSLPEGKIEMSYQGIPVDNNGFPLIPENSLYMRALELFIKKEKYQQLFEQGKLPLNVVQMTQQDYCSAVAMYRADVSTPSIDEMESARRMWTRFLPDVRAHANGFVSTSIPEIKKI